MPPLKMLAALSALVLAPPSAALAQDAASGERLFNRCRACHAVGPNATNKVGPVLNGVVGRAAGAAEGYSFSAAMKEAGAGGLVWDEETISAYLADPRGFIKGNRMAFAGMRKAEEIADIVAYLKTFSEPASN